MKTIDRRWRILAGGITITSVVASVAPSDGVAQDAFQDIPVVAEVIEPPAAPVAAPVTAARPIIGVGVGLFEPEVTTVATGTITNVQGAVQADQRYVKLSTSPKVLKLDRVDTFQFQTPSGFVGGVNPTGLRQVKSVANVPIRSVNAVNLPTVGTSPSQIEARIEADRAAQAAAADQAARDQISRESILNRRGMFLLARLAPAGQ